MTNMHPAPHGRGAPRTGRKTPAVAVGLLVALSVAGCTGADPGDRAAAATSSAAGGDVGVELQASYEHVIADVLPSVVEIRSSTGLGSGVVYDRHGDIVTNAHVVGSDTTFQVLSAASAKAMTATLVGVYQPNDIAVIKVDGGSDLQPATFADSSKADVGEIVLAMGNPLGLSATVTNGIISALGRTVSEPTTQESPGATLPNTIQTSASINPGNSGGALVDLRGRVVGIPTLAALAPPNEGGGAAPGIGFAIPSDDVRRIADQLVKTGSVTSSGRAALNVGVTTLTDQSGAPQGVGVVTVADGGAAQQAGIQPGDVIVSVDGKKTPTAQALGAVLAELHVGDKVRVGVLRGGDQKQLTVTLGELGG